uniref:Uncharacterized protein n=1 Tax=viral metagenome TaxID=1070528 RepID=A0A6M3LS13_9ZZZZ
MKKLEDCSKFDVCTAPICPLDSASLETAVWYPNEDICKIRMNLPWRRIQRRIAKRAKDHTRYFTLKDFQVKRVQNPKGHNPDRVVHEPSKTSVYTPVKKTKGK